MGISYPGGIKKIEIADAEDFDTATDANFLVTIDRNSLAKEGTEVPDPESVTAELADDRQVRMGVDQSISLRLTELPQADFDTLETATKEGTEVFIKMTSTQTDGSGNPRWEIVYRRVILSNVSHGPAKADRSSYGVVIIDGMTTGGETADIYTLTQNSGGA